MFKLSICFIILTALWWAQADADHVFAVMRFEDSSGFGGQWDLGGGFARLLSERLDQIKGYTVVWGDSAMSVPDGRRAGCPSGDDSEAMAALFDSLQTGHLVCGTVDEFGISRFGIATPGLGGYQSYKAVVGLNFCVWESGAEVPLLTDASEGIIRQGGLGITFLGKPTEEMEEYQMLDHLEFGSQEFMGTIIGMAIDTVLSDMVEKIQLTLPPQRELGDGVGAAVVISVDGEDVYINRGFEDGLKVGDQFDIYTRGDELRDPQTGRVLGHSDRKVGSIRVAFVKSAHLSRAEAIEGEGQVKPGDEVRVR